MGVNIGRLTMLQAALEALDRADAARQAVEAEGMTFKTERTGAIHINPMVKVEKDARQQFAKLWHELGLSRAASRL